MRNILVLSLAFIATCLIGQTHEFEIDWKKGDKRKIKTTLVRKDYINDALDSDTTIYSESVIQVGRVEKEYVYFDIVSENIALQQVTEFYDKLGKEFDDYRNLTLKYKAHRKTGEYDLLNWEEAQTFMMESIKQMKAAVSKDAENLSSMLEYVLMPLEELYSSKENIMASVADELDFILLPYGKKFEEGKQLSKTENQPNPFNPAQEMEATTNWVLKDYNKKAGTCLIKQEVVLDFSEFKEMMKSMMRRMMEEMVKNDSTMESKLKEIDDLEIDMTNEQDVYYNIKSSWVTKVIATGAVFGTDPQTGKRRTELVSTIVFE